MKTETKESQLLEFAHLLINNGFQVYIPSSGKTYCHFVKNNRIGYVEAGDWGFNFGTTHKPNGQCGTGFSIHHDTIPNVQMAEDCLILAPVWASNTDIQAIVKYKDWAEYVKLNNWQTWVEL
jgi:hypothetical protein